MKVTLAAEITPAKLRSGGPAALAALCDRRGAAVFAYCQKAAGKDAGAEVAAAAFAGFRRAILRPGSLTSGAQAEVLLRGVTRRAALVHIGNAAVVEEGSRAAGCDGRAVEILGYFENTLAPADREALTAHIGRCHACAAVLQRLTDAEPAFKVRPGTVLPVDVAREILLALVHAAPVDGHEGNENAVGDEALRLLTAEQAAAGAAPAAPEPPDRGDDPKPVAEERKAALLAEPPPAPPPVPTPPTPSPRPPVARPVRPQAPTGTRGNTPRRPRFRLPSFGPAHFGPSRSAMLLRGAAKLVAVVVIAGAAGVLLGLAMAELTGDDAAPTPSAAVPTSSTPRATTATSAATAPATTEKVRVAVASATARPPADGAEQGSRLSVRASVENASGRAIRPKQPQLLVDDLRVAAAPEFSGTGGELLAPSLADGATAAGTLRFEVPSKTPSELTTSRVRLQIAGKIVVLSPKLGETAPGG